MIKVEGTRQLEVLAAQLQAAGNVTLRRQMLRNIRVAVEPVVPAIRDSALSTLPRSGGAAQWVASSDIRVGSSFTPRTATVAVRMRQSHAARSAAKARAKAAGSKYRGSAVHDLKAIDGGVLRHPLFGNREHWFDTEVRPGFFTVPCFRAAPAVLAACDLTCMETARAAGFTE